MNPVTPTQPPARPRHTRNVPEAAKSLSALLDLAVAEWKKRPQLTLEWTTHARVQSLADELRQGLRDTEMAHDSLAPKCYACNSSTP